ncbi:MAG: hypothetical protein H6813_05025 [Phycisphaeraceae bacterium]|nr:hypothetical protein [Phycisphaeraceae bacterium]MCB9847746.1 hypothetical protein [Phycisphaeraceae bacterium]
MPRPTTTDGVRARDARSAPWPWFAVVALIAAALLWRPQAQAQPGGAGVPVYHYAIISFQGNDAIVYYDGGTRFYEGPDVIKQERVEGNNNLKLVPIIQLTHLDTMGSVGWEVVRPWGADGNSWLLRSSTGIIRE